MHQPDAGNPVARDLLAWFAQARRDLPWRHTRDPYRIWVAEIMLAQTQVARVLGYYERFLERFPSVAALAAAPLGEVLKAWEGLGYYARARHLHRAAQEIMARHGGRFPEDPAAVRALPGVGAYSAAAILSIAFGRDEAALDGNVRRVLARLFCLPAPGEAALRALAAGLLPHGRAGDFNQAMMDLGATVCTPRRPGCDACPLAAHCRAHAEGREAGFPAPRPRRALPHYDVCAAVIEHEGRLLIAQRPAEGLLGGLWEFPGGKVEPGETLEDCLRREIREELAVEIAVGAPVATVEHAYTHLRITLHAFRCRLLSGEPQAVAAASRRWVRPGELERYAFSAADRQVIAALR
ncbi:MAG TPA: A/G-specific adenine glycosylase [Anaerolineae bacterium]|nr:A/G-specific adenine glycosylase [Anaerolineae bacterium]